MELAGTLALNDVETLVVRGPDRVSWLEGLCTNTVKRAPGGGCYACFLQPKGKLLTDADLRVYDDRIEIDTPGGRRDPLAAMLDRVIIMEDVQLAPEARYRLAVFGPAAIAAAERAAHATLPAVENDFAVGENGATLARTWYGAELVTPNILNIETQKITAESFESLRIERGVPKFGVDFSEDANPLEAGLDRALEFKKGCYVGQEVIAKITFRGHVHKRLMRVSIEGAPALGWVNYLDAEPRKAVTLLDGRDATVLGFPYRSKKNPVGD